MKRTSGLNSRSTLTRSTLKRTATLKSGGTLERGNGLKASPPSPEDQKAALKKSTLRLLDKARNDAKAKGVDLTEWEGEFIEGVSERVKTYGRAFSDPDKGAMNGTLSLRQGVKLREIRKKIKLRAQPSSDEEMPK